MKRLSILAICLTITIISCSKKEDPKPSNNTTIDSTTTTIPGVGIYIKSNEVNDTMLFLNQNNGNHIIIMKKYNTRHLIQLEEMPYDWFEYYNTKTYYKKLIYRYFKYTNYNINVSGGKYIYEKDYLNYVNDSK